MEKMKMSVQDYQKTERIFGQLRIINALFLAFEILSLVLVNLVTVGYYLDNETCINIMGFLSEHDTVIMLLGVGTAAITVLYNIFLMKIPFPGNDFLLVGIVGFVSFLYEGRNISTSSTGNNVINSITTSVSAALIAIVIIVIFRKLYCDAMGKMSSDLSEKAQKSWEGLWRLTRLICVISFLLIVVLKYMAQGLYKTLDRWSDDYDKVLNTVLISLVVITCLALVVEIVLRIKELNCLQVTQRQIKDKCTLMRQEEEALERKAAWRSEVSRQKDMLKQYDMHEDAPEEEEDDSWLRRKD